MKIEWLARDVLIVYPENQHAFDNMGVTDRPNIDRFEPDALDQGRDSNFCLGIITNQGNRNRAAIRFSSSKGKSEIA